VEQPGPLTREFELWELPSLFADARWGTTGSTRWVRSRAVLPAIYFAGIGAVFIGAAVGVGYVGAIAGYGAGDAVFIAGISVMAAACFAAAVSMVVWKRAFHIDRDAGRAVLCERRVGMRGVKRSETEMRPRDARLRASPACAWLYPGRWRGWVLELEFGTPDCTPLVVSRGSEERVRAAARELAIALDIPLE
jgi:hypothetical protein